MSTETESADPKVTVLMPVYNAESTLREAMDSILAQTLTDFEFLIVDDGSTDGSAVLVRSYSDPRIRLVQNERNLKLAATLNRGLDLARGEYVARMDADDVSLPDRLARQAAFLDSHPGVGLCGTWAEAFGAGRFSMPNPTGPETIRAKLLFDSALVHPSVMLRRGLFNRHGLRYPPLAHFEDYALWQQAARLFPLANLPAVLLRYRVTPQSAFHGANEAERRAVYARLDREALAFLGIDPTPAELAVHQFLRCPTEDHTDEAEAWLLRLNAANAASHYYDPAAFREALRERWFLVCYLLPGGGLARWRRYVGSPLYGRGDVTARAHVKVLAKFLVQRLRGQ